MSATPARIGFIMQQFRRVTIEDDDVQAAYGSLARKSEDPVETFFDSSDDAEVVARERMALLSAARRRFRLTTSGIDQTVTLDYRGKIPVARYIDTERDCDRQMLIGDLTIDLANHSTSMTVWG